MDVGAGVATSRRAPRQRAPSPTWTVVALAGLGLCNCASLAPAAANARSAWPAWPRVAQSDATERGSEPARARGGPAPDDAVLGHAALEWGELDCAAQALSRALAADPAALGVRLDRAELDLWQALLTRNAAQFARARDALRQIAHACPCAPRVRRLLELVRLEEASFAR